MKTEQELQTQMQDIMTGFEILKARYRDVKLELKKLDSSYPMLNIEEDLEFDFEDEVVNSMR